MEPYRPKPKFVPPVDKQVFVSPPRMTDVEFDEMIQQIYLGTSDNKKTLEVNQLLERAKNL
jgi:hypothetical protein